jgi:hypothetical protein
VTVTETSPVPVPELSPSPTDRKVDGCVIKPQADCRRGDLSGANLHDANLHGANFELANLTAADLQRANLRNATFKNATLQDADMESAHLQHADLFNANLQRVDLSWANLTSANLKGAELNGATLCHTIMTNGTENNSGCEAPSPTPAPTESPTTTPAQPSPKIKNVSFKQRQDCLLGTTSVSVRFFYHTANATAWQLLVNNKMWDSDAPDGNSKASETMNLKCKQAPWTITLKASNESGTATKSLTIEGGPNN